MIETILNEMMWVVLMQNGTMMQMTVFKDKEVINEVDFDIGRMRNLYHSVKEVVNFGDVFESHKPQEEQQHLLMVVEYSVDFQNVKLYFQIHSSQHSMNEIVLMRLIVLNSLIQILEFEDVLLMIQIRSVGIYYQLLSIHGNMDVSDNDEHCISHPDHI
ncbi:MAG: hypothetical protein EZS28_038389, partial [Streblomastix strix]